MLKPKNISFYSLFNAGFISAKTYRALKPKTRINQLSISDCYHFSLDISRELIRLFEDQELVSRIFYLETIEQDINDGSLEIFEMLDKMLNSASSKIKEIVNKIGPESFLVKYLVCSSQVLSNLYFINEDNINEVDEFRTSFLNAFFSTANIHDQPYYNSDSQTSLNDVITVVEEPNTGLYNNSFEKGFTGKDVFEIDEDVLSDNDNITRQYILFLYSIDVEKFKFFEDFLNTEMRLCPVRMYNSIRSLGARRFLVNYLFAREQKLLQIPKFGKRSVEDFLKIKNVIVEFVKDSYNNRESLDFKYIPQVPMKVSAPVADLTLVDKLGTEQYALILHELRRLKSELSVRACNAVDYYGEINFLEDYVNKNSDVKTLRNIGRKTEIELVIIIKKLKAQIISMGEKQLSKEELNWYSKLLLYGDFIDDYAKDTYKQIGRLPMLHILQNAFNIYLTQRDFMVFQEVSPINNDRPAKSYLDVADEFDLSRERIRQLYNRTLDFISLKNISDKNIGPSYIKLFSNKEDWDYLRNILKEKIFWQLSDISAIAEDEKCNLTSRLITHIISIVFNEDISIIGKKPLSLYIRRQTWENTFIVSKSITSIFDFNKVWQITTDFIEETIGDKEFTLNALILDVYNDAWIDFDISKIKDIEFIVSQILIFEFGIYPELNGDFIIHGHKKQETSDVLYAILKEIGNPISLDELFDRYEKVYPGKYKSSSSLRAIIYRDARIYMISNTNNAALYEWEHVAIGSIRDLIVEYLAKFDEPQPISAIISHVKSLRDTTDNSIRSSIGSGSQFKQFAGGFCGLADREYPEWYNLSESERNARSMIVEFEHFLLTEQHFPFSQSKDEKESRLYQWWYRIKKEQNLSELLKQAIHRIEVSFVDTPHTRSEYQWFLELNKYKSFVLLNKRKPSKRFVNEVYLERWFDKTLNQLSESRLAAWQEKAFYDLCGLIQ